MLQKKRFLVFAFSALVVGACNIYSPLSSPSTDEEFVEEGRKCLLTSNYDCAIAQYNRISDATLKNQQLCLANISKAGLNLTALINVLSSSSAGTGTMILVANELLKKGFTETRLAAAAASISPCGALGSDDTSTLLKVLSRVADCGIRIAKANYLVATDDSVSTTCSSATAGARTGVVSTSDIGGDGTGAVSGANPGMCYADVQVCIDDMSAASTLLGGGSFSAIRDNILSLPADLIAGGTGLAAVRATRVGLKVSVP